MTYDEWLNAMRLRGYDAGTDPEAFRRGYDAGLTPDDFAISMIGRASKPPLAPLAAPVPITAPKPRGTSPLALGFFVFVVLGGLGVGLKEIVGGTAFVSTESLRSKVSAGMTYEEVRAAIGEPETAQKMEGATPIGNEIYKTDTQTWYYKGASLQIVFDKGRVTMINQY